MEPTKPAYRIESLVYSKATGTWNLCIEHTDKRDLAMANSQWIGMFMPHYGLVVGTDTGKIEYEFGSTNRDWIKWAFERYFDSLPVKEA